MKENIGKVLVSVLAVLVVWPVHAEPTSKKFTNSASAATRLESFRLLRQLSPMSLPIPVGTPDCSADAASDDCNKKIYLQKGEVSYSFDGISYTKKICVAVTYDVRVKIGTGLPKKINYTLESKDPSIVSPVFFDAHIHSDSSSQHSSTEVKPQKLTIKTRRSVDKSEIVFLPAIKWKNGTEWTFALPSIPKS